jgi:hypothetical protein
LSLITQELISSLTPFTAVPTNVCTDNFLHNEPATGSPSSLLGQVNAVFRENYVMALLPEVGKSNFFRERIVISPHSHLNFQEADKSYFYGKYCDSPQPGLPEAIKSYF